MADIPSGPTAFEVYRQAQKTRKLTPPSEGFTALADLAIAAISRGQGSDAIAILGSLKECIIAASNILDGKPKMLLTHLMEIKVLQHENCELRLKLARLHGDKEEIVNCEEELTIFDQYFASAISGLDG